MNNQQDTLRVLERDLAPIASLIGDPTRIVMLAALAEGRSLPASERPAHATTTSLDGAESSCETACWPPTRCV
jgi:uridine phosphorylase